MTDLNSNNPDQMLQTTLRARLAEAPGLNDVHAVVTGGTAILTGQVPDPVDIKRALMIATNVEGMLEAREELKVAASSSGERESYFDPVEGISSHVPITGERVMDAAQLDEAPNPTKIADEDKLADYIKEGMDIYDSEGKKVGKVKEVRATDFLLSRFLAKNYYVPYFSCTLEADGVHLKIAGSEMKDQGWAFPHQETP